MGPLTFGKKEEQIFLGREIAQHQDYSEDTAVNIDKEIRGIIQRNYDRARTLLEQHKNAAAGDRRGTAGARGARRRAGPPHRRRRAARGTPRRPRRRCDRRWHQAPDEGTAFARAADSAAEQADDAGVGPTFRSGVFEKPGQFDRGHSRTPDLKVGPTGDQCDRFAKALLHPAARRRSPRPRRAHARHGHPQHHAGFVRRRRRALRRRSGGRRRVADGGAKAPTSSTSAASPHAQAPTKWAPTRRCGECCR